MRSENGWELAAALPTVTEAPSDRRDRWAFRGVMFVAVLPLFVDAVRQGLGGWVPAQDAAATVFRARASFGTHPEMLGMFAAGGSTLHDLTFFPGPWELWWLWGPTRILGITWGPLLGMALLNAFWIVLAGWTLKRRQGRTTGVWALAFLGILVWSLGTGMFLDPTPMIMIVPAFASFLFIAWALAAGDEAALPAFALVVNFLVLDHLALTMVVPLIGVTALLIWGAGLWHHRQSERDTWPVVRRRAVHAIGWAGLVTVIAWIPSLIEELHGNPGNLTNLWRAGTAQPEPLTSASGAFATMMSVFSRWPFWLRGSLNLFLNPFAGTTPASGTQIGIGVMMLVAAGILAWFAFRRRDRAAFTAVVFAVGVLVSVYLSMYRSPGKLLWTYYYADLWPTAMFVTFAGVFAAARSLPARIRRHAPNLGMVVVLVVALGNLRHTSSPPSMTGGTDTKVAVARSLDPQVVRAVRGLGASVKLKSKSAQRGSPLLALTLDLAAAGIPVCLQFVGPWRGALDKCNPGERTVGLTIYPTHARPDDRPDGTRTIAHASAPFGSADLRELRALTHRIRTTVAARSEPGRHVTLAPRARSYLDEIPMEETLVRFGTETMAKKSAAELLATPEQRAHTAGKIMYWARWARAAGVPRLAIIEIPGVTDDELLRWADLTERWVSSAYTVVLVPEE